MHRRLAVRGDVQGAGFRPWVWREATSLGIIGWVRNTGFGVEIDLHGPPPSLDALQAQLWRAPPPTRIDRIDVLNPQAPEERADAMPASTPRSLESLTAHAPMPGAAVGADLGPCRRCLSELFDPANRRWRHPFISCPQCGPHYTITRALPFDRGHTSLAPFLPCSACEAEFRDRADRRHLHQTNTCPQCGPHLWFKQIDGGIERDEPISAALGLLRDGGLLAMKGTGGFHLYCDARQAQAVARLRQRKHIAGRPLPVMVANAASIPPWASMTPHEQRWLQSPERPVVLLQQTDRARKELPDVAPDLAWLGLALPSTPLHHLLFHEACGRPIGSEWLTRPHDMVLATSSGNVCGAPLAIDNETAMLELADMADGWLLHDMDILARNDDSVLRVRPDGTACFLRRGRGHAPAPAALPPTPESPLEDMPLPPSVLALGAMQKSTVCITQGDRAMVSPHVGDLNAVDTRVVFTRLADGWPGWLRTQAEVLACDLHPDFFSSILAAHMSHTQASAAADIAPLTLVRVQHHHAHVAAVMAEHSEEKAVRAAIIGLALDGHGMGTDGQIWGGELLRVDQDGCQRLGHLWPMPMPEGDAGTRVPWRMACAVLHVLGMTDKISSRFGSRPQAQALQQWLGQGPHRHLRTTSLGRLFDAAAGLLDLLPTEGGPRYEAEAAMRLESLASRAWPADPLLQGWHITDDLIMDWRPLMKWLSAQDPSADVAAVFHATVAAALTDWAARACARHEARTIVLSGGCMVNRLLDDAVHAGLTAAGFTVWRPTQYPCGDGAISLGQAWVVRQMWMRRHFGDAATHIAARSAA